MLTTSIFKVPLMAAEGKIDKDDAEENGIAICATCENITSYSDMYEHCKKEKHFLHYLMRDKQFTCAYCEHKFKESDVMDESKDGMKVIQEPPGPDGKPGAQKVVFSVSIGGNKEEKK